MMELSSQDSALLQSALDYICKNHVPGCDRATEAEAHEFANSCKQKLKAKPAVLNLVEIETVLFAITAYADYLSAPPRQINEDQLFRLNALKNILDKQADLISDALNRVGF